jgi:hypothetical protein
MYSKADQLKKNRTTKKPSMKNKPKITQHERDYLQWLKEQDLSCFSCGKKRGVELHHIKQSSSDRKNHLEVIPLCGVTCHRLGEYSAHSNPRWFRSEYPIEVQRKFAKILYKEFTDGLQRNHN